MASCLLISGDSGVAQGLGFWGFRGSGFRIYRGFRGLGFRMLRGFFDGF